MKIDKKTDVPPTVTPQAQAMRRKKLSTYTKSTPPAAGRGDSVEVSEAARARQVATESLKQFPATRTEKVERLKSAIKTGTYKVSGKDIAQKILDENS